MPSAVAHGHRPEDQRTYGLYRFADLLSRYDRLANIAWCPCPTINCARLLLMTLMSCSAFTGPR
jgi:hypothetical protein